MHHELIFKKKNGNEKAACIVIGIRLDGTRVYYRFNDVKKDLWILNS